MSAWVILSRSATRYFHFTATNYKYHTLPATKQGKFHWGSGIKLEMALFKKHLKRAWPRAVLLTWDSQVPNSTTGMPTSSPQTDCSLQFVTKHHECHWRRRISLKPKGFWLQTAQPSLPLFQSHSSRLGKRIQCFFLIHFCVFLFYYFNSNSPRINNILHLETIIILKLFFTSFLCNPVLLYHEDLGAEHYPH